MNMLSSMMSSLKELESDLEQTWQRLALSQDLESLVECRALLAQADIWQNNARRAQTASQQLAKLEKKTKPWQKLKSDLDDLKALLASYEVAEDDALLELQSLIESWSQEFAHLKEDFSFEGPYDDHEVILSIFAGAGGTDAQDWAQMLMRMYHRWAERSSVEVELISQSKGEEAGLKSVSLYLKKQPFLYGRLRGEHGVHRLVRLSPFNAQNLRQTSFAKVEIMPALEQPDTVALDDSELRFDFFRSGGHGGQSVNTTDSAVRVTHLPSKLTVVIQNERSQIQNKQLALIVLRSRLASLEAEKHTQALKKLKGASSANEWGSQIRNYVLHPYKQVKDLRSQYVTTDVQKVLDGQIDDLLIAWRSMAARPG